MHPTNHRLAVLVTTAGLGAFSASCLARPVVSNPPELQTNVAYTEVDSQITQVDLLFDIDNSTSMGDKQEFLRQAIPDLVGRLISPNCLPQAGGAPYRSASTSTSPPTCKAGDKLEFSAVADMHIAVVTSSLGGRGGSVCSPTATTKSGTPIYSPRADDQGHLIGNGTQPGSASIPGLTAANFLAWYPSWTTGDAGTTPVETDPSQTTGFPHDFGDLVADVGTDGCGIESQLESWYRFLIQPDPYRSIDVSNGVAAWSDAIDTDVLRERAAFLRPNSLVAVIVLTDENDSEIDARALRGTAYAFMDYNPNGQYGPGGGVDFQPCRGTAICASDPGNPACQYDGTQNGCGSAPYAALNDWGYDVNLRHVHMKEKYGLDPQYPISRYVNGLTSATVPDRNGEYPDPNQAYAGTNNCENPLFAPDLSRTTPPPGAAWTYSQNHDALCNSAGKSGPRTPGMVFYAIIGGVPYQDLHYPAPSPDGGEVDWSKYALSKEDWTWIVGKDPEHYDYSGKDPHMIEDYAPRQKPTFEKTAGGTAPSSDPLARAALGLPGATNRAGGGWDPINGREWSTDDLSAKGDPLHAGNNLLVDRQYACIFKLPSAHDCANAAVAHAGCDCQATNLTHEQTPPVCDETTPTMQTYAKAYPTIRELLVAKDLGDVAGANAGVVSSICPVDTVDNSLGTDPYYGYRPAMAAIVEKLSSKLKEQCIPPLQADPKGHVPCLLLAELPGQDPNGHCVGAGLSDPDPAVLEKFREKNPIAKDALVCSVTETPVPAGATCAAEMQNPGWCYVAGTNATGTACSQQIVIADALRGHGLDNAVISYQCIETYNPDGG